MLRVYMPCALFLRAWRFRCRHSIVFAEFIVRLDAAVRYYDCLPSYVTRVDCRYAVSAACLSAIAAITRCRAIAPPYFATPSAPSLRYLFCFVPCFIDAQSRFCFLRLWRDIYAGACCFTFSYMTRYASASVMPARCRRWRIPRRAILLYRRHARQRWYWSLIPALMIIVKEFCWFWYARCLFTHASARVCYRARYGGVADAMMVICAFSARLLPIVDMLTRDERCCWYLLRRLCRLAFEAHVPVHIAHR